MSRFSFRLNKFVFQSASKRQSSQSDQRHRPAKRFLVHSASIYSCLWSTDYIRAQQNISAEAFKLWKSALLSEEERSYHSYLFIIDKNSFNWLFEIIVFIFSRLAIAFLFIYCYFWHLWGPTSLNSTLKFKSLKFILVIIIFIGEKSQVRVFRTRLWGATFFLSLPWFLLAFRFFFEKFQDEIFQPVDFIF